MRRLIQHKRESFGLGLAITDGLFFGLTDPAKAPSAFFIVAFALLGVSIYLALRYAFKGLQLYGLNVKHARRMAASVTGGVCGVLALQSVGQLTARDVAVFMPLAALAYFYVAYSRRHYAQQ